MRLPPLLRPRPAVPSIVPKIVLCLVAAAGGAGCISARLTPEADAGPRDGGPTARNDIVAPVGGDDTLDVGAWNLKNFPCGNDSNSTTCRDGAADTPALVADLIASLDVDLLAVEEIADEGAFAEVLSRLPGRDGVLSPDVYFDGTYQKTGFIWKTAVLDAGDPSALFETDGDFPRAPLQVPFTWKGPGAPFSFFAVAVHLKAGGADEDIARRTGSIQRLESYARTLVDGAGNDDIVILGDYNETVTDAAGRAVFQPFRDDTRYAIRTEPAADAGGVSFLPGGVVIDHIVTTSAMNAAIGGNDAVIPRLDRDVEDYRGRVSDHLPVFLTLGAP